MQVKHVKQYFETICNQRQEMIEVIKDLEEEQQKGLYPPEHVDQVKQQAKPLMDNYERLAYIMFLLDKPQKKQKEQAYIKRNRKFIEQLDKNNSLKQQVDENQEQITNLKSMK